METFIAFIDDGEYAVQSMIPMLHSTTQAKWILVACPPKLNRHSSKWITQKAMKRWQSNWSQKCLQSLIELLNTKKDTYITRTANGSLIDLSTQLKTEYQPSRILDWRRPKLGVQLEPLTIDQPQNDNKWVIPSGVIALGSVMAIAID